MFTMSEDSSTLYRALLARDPAYDGRVYVGVATTGIFCRMTCPARKPLFENVTFYETPAQCLEAGFRPCLRCAPLKMASTKSPVVEALLAALDADPGRVWREGDLAAMGHDPSTVRRAFRRYIGMTFLDLARLRRTSRAVLHLAAGAPVIVAQLDAGFESGSGFRDAVTRLVESNPQSLRGRTLLRADWIDTPLGPMLGIADASHLHLLEFADRKGLPLEIDRLRRTSRLGIAFQPNAVLTEGARQLASYFRGESACFTLPLAEHGSPFVRTVRAELRTIPAGTTRSYAAVARGIGQPSASRAVAQTNGANPIAIIVPCHRVIGSDGSLAGYGGGLHRKRWLLAHERRHFLQLCPRRVS